MGLLITDGSIFVTIALQGTAVHFYPLMPNLSHLLKIKIGSRYINRLKSMLSLLYLWKLGDIWLIQNLLKQKFNDYNIV